MTFIASVIAKKGVAIIADSLVTSIRPIIEKQAFLKYVKSKNNATQKNKIAIEFDEVVKLFKNTTSHTKDYEEKLFKYDDYTAITTVGHAVINEKRIADIVSELYEYNNKKNKRSYSSKNLKTKIKDFTNHLTNEVKEHVMKFGNIGNTSFIITHYNKSLRQTIIYKIEVVDSIRENLTDDNYVFVKYEKHPEIYNVICDGQNRISERILFGDSGTIYSIIQKVVDATTTHLNIDRNSVPPEIVVKIFSESEIIDQSFIDDMKIFQLSQLSLQQAVDLACLLMRIEMDFQKYTKNIPTVGGVIRLAIIDDEGFRFIHGYDILKPDVI